MKFFIFYLLWLPSFSFASGLIFSKNSDSVEVNLQRVLKRIEDKGIKVFTVINHSEGAESVGQELRDTRVVIFGNPKVGSRLMNKAPSLAIDLPQKIAIYANEQGGSTLVFNDPQYLGIRHELNDPALEKIKKLLSELTKP